MRRTHARLTHIISSQTDSTCLERMNDLDRLVKFTCIAYRIAALKHPPTDSHFGSERGAKKAAPTGAAWIIAK